MSRNRNLEMGNYFNTLEVLDDLRRREREEFGFSYGGVGLLHRAEVDCTSFMDANPDAQLKFAQETGLFPEA